ncbi:hypothetical protein GCM10025794_25750 [Massilia kyonggiensis]
MTSFVLMVGFCRGVLHLSYNYSKIAQKLVRPPALGAIYCLLFR